MTTHTATHIIFDCDGVLVDSEAVFSQHLAIMLQAEGYPFSLEYCRHHFAGKAFTDFKKEIEAEHHPVSHDFHERFMKQVGPLLSDVKKIEGVDDVISKIKIPKAVASSSDPWLIEKFLSQNNLLHYFGTHYYSAKTAGQSKPAPDVYQYAIKALETESSACIAIEDSVVGVTAARAAGIPWVIGFTGAGHNLHGQGDRLIAVGAIEVATNMKEIPDLLKKYCAISPF